MERQKRFIINCLYFGIILAAVYLLVKFAFPVLAPFLIGFLIAYILRRPIRFLSERFHIPKKLTAIGLVAVFYVTIGSVLVLGSIQIFSSAASLVESLPALFRDYVIPVLTELFDTLGEDLAQMDPGLVDTLEEMGRQFIQSLASGVSSLSMSSMLFLSGIASSLPMLFIRLVLMIISTFFIAADYERLTEFCMRQLSRKARRVFHQVKQYIVGTLFVCIRSYALIMSITFVELSIGLSVIGISHSVLIALGISIFDILPVLGTGGIMIPWAVITFILGDYAMAVKLLLVYVIITVVRNILEPKIVGGQLGLHPIVTLASMFAGVELLGVVGLFGFPILLSLLKYLDETGTIRIFRREGEQEEEEEDEKENGEKENGGKDVGKKDEK